ncbi:MAG: glycosyltransferase [Rhodobacteraceae bacterium]|nr:glycosyltransferase [Paracoccaceae bacterium]
MSSLLMLSPAPLVEVAGGEVVLDVKFVEGMKLHCQLWPGPVRCVLWRDRRSIDDPMRYSVTQLGFELIVLDPGAPVPGLLLDESSLVYCAADDLKHLNLPEAMRGRIGKLVYSVEQALAGRMAAGIAQHAKMRRRIGSVVYNLRKERHLRRALSQADGLHCNGYPAQVAYGRLSDRMLPYLDNRLRTPMIVRATEQEDRARHLQSGAPLRLVWYGMLTPESRIVDILPVAHLLANRGTAFTLELFGTGPEQGRLRDGIAALGLSSHMRLSEPKGFDARLVPHLRQSADVFVSMRRLPTPLSSYVEALGCGLPILGVRNTMWSRLQAVSDAGWVVRRGGAGAMVAAIERLDTDRAAIVAASDRAVSFARANTFESVFARRMTDLRDIAQAE